MKFAIKHERPGYYLNKSRWYWTNTLDANTTYAEDELVPRITRDAENFKEVVGVIKIVVVHEVPASFTEI